MFSALLITLREGLEAALIIVIILAYLTRTDNRQGFKKVWIGTILAIVTSLVAAAIIHFTAGKLEGQTEKIFEGFVMLIAVSVLTWMVFWMRKHAVHLKGQLHAQIEAELGKNSSLGLFMLAFVAVVREGIETVLFLFAATRVTASGILSTIGGILGLVLAIAIGYGVYRGISKLNLRTFFSVTSLLLILFAAGLLAHGIHKFHEAGIIPPVVEHVWDVNHILPEESTFGRLLTAIFGYNADPSLIELVAYFGYLGFTLTGFFRSMFGKKERTDLPMGTSEISEAKTRMVKS